MSIFDLLKDKLVADRKVDEAYFAAALQEYQSGHIRPGLMAKAITESQGDQNKAKAIYLRLLTAAVKDDVYIANRTEENRQAAIRNQEREHKQNLLMEQKSLTERELRNNTESLSKQADKKQVYNDIASILILIVIIGCTGFYINSVTDNFYLNLFQDITNQVPKEQTLPLKQTLPPAVSLPSEPPAKTVIHSQPNSSGSTTPQQITSPNKLNYQESPQAATDRIYCSRIYWKTVNAAKNKPIGEYSKIEKEAAANEQACLQRR